MSGTPTVHLPQASSSSVQPLSSFWPMAADAASRAFASRGTTPDENFAREIMQLFTIGLWMLRSDGSYETDAAGSFVPTYDNDDIMDFARAWTGFDRQAFRGNIEAVKGYTGGNWIDPMSIDADWRDVFPKMDLRDGFIGDRYPLCADAPPSADAAK